MPEGQVILGCSFLYGGDEIIVEIVHAEERDQVEHAGIIKTSSIHVGANELVYGLYEDIVEQLDQLVSAIYEEIHSPAPTRPLGRRPRDEDDDDED